MLDVRLRPYGCVLSYHGVSMVVVSRSTDCGQCVGINFAAYEALRGVITPPGKSSAPRKLLCGALAGATVNDGAVMCSNALICES